MPERLFSIPETAERLRTSRSTVYRLIAAGDLHAVEFGAVGVTKRYRVPASELDRFIHSLEEVAA